MKHGRNIAHVAAGVLYGLTMGIATAAPLNIADVPLFLPGAVPPLNMLVMGRDHRMYYEAYNDASDLNGDGVLDIGYKPAEIDYYGYFDSHAATRTASGVFSPTTSRRRTRDAPVPREWSGDWLNYMTTSRIDALRKVLYGGLRSTDTATDTVLQRAYIPQDAHSWGKEYTSVAVDGYDIEDYTPLAQPIGYRHAPPSVRQHDACGLGRQGTRTRHQRRRLPLLRVVENQPDLKRVWNWVSNERPVADTRRRSTATSARAVDADRLRRARAGLRDGHVRSARKANCQIVWRAYAKPIGLLQEYGENDTMCSG